MSQIGSTTYNRHHSKRISHSVQQLNSDLSQIPFFQDTMSNTVSSNLDSDSTSVSSSFMHSNHLQINGEQELLDDEYTLMYKILPTSTMSPKKTSIICKDDDGHVNRLEIERVYYPNNIRESQIRTKKKLFRKKRLSSTQKTKKSQMKNISHLKISDKTRNTMRNLLTDKIPIIGKQTYCSTLKDLRSKIGKIQTFSLKLHSYVHHIFLFYFPL